MPSPTTPRPVADLTYEQARDELVAVVQRLEAGGETLEGSLELWERGEALAARCQQWLDGARERLDAARTGASGAAPTGRVTPDRVASDRAGHGAGEDPTDLTDDALDEDDR